MRIYIPPNGFVGQAQQTTANQLVGAARVARNGNGKRRRRAAKPASMPRKRSSSARPARLVKGSAAAKRYMAKIRRKRKK